MRAPALAGLLAVALAAAAPAQESCGTWTEVPVPFDDAWWTAELQDVTVLPDGTAWASGHYKTLIQPGWQIETFSLSMSWDGSAWTHVPTQNPSPYPGGTKVYLNGIDAVSADDVWAGGSRYGDAGGLSVGDWPLVQHWDGSSWELVPVPEPPGGAGINFSGPRIWDVVALASDNVWFGGLWGEPNQLATVTWRPLAMHWDGSDLSVHDTPVVFAETTSFGFQIVDFSALGPDDIWAACNVPSAGGQSRKNVVLHYDGSDWSRADIPDADHFHTLREVVAIAPDDVWVFGDEDTWPATPFTLHYDGSSWTEMAGPALVTGAVALAADEIHLGQTEISVFDGTDSTVLFEVPDTHVLKVFDMAVAGPCSAWAVGRTTGPATRPFAARLDATSATASWAELGGGLPGSHGTPTLFGDGELMPATEVRLDLGAAMEMSSSTLVVGLSAANVPVYGGTLVPFPDLLLPGLPTGPAGAWSLLDTWPAGVPAGTSVWFQAWVQDPAGPFGWSATRALRADVP